MRFERVKDAPAETKLPTRSTAKSAGYDFYSPQEFVIPGLMTVKIVTNVKVQIDEGYFLEIVPRSSMGIKRNLMLANGTGIIDADYYGNPDNDGNIIIAMRNYGMNPQTIKKGERFAQGIFVPFGVVDDDEADGERTGGIGSTGK